MAIQHAGLKKVGEYWHYALTINGQRLHGSTRSKDLATAKKILEERRKDALLNQIGVHKVPTLSDLVKQWLQNHKGVHSRKHWVDVESVSRNWLLPSLGTKKIDHISTEDVSRIRSRMLEAGRSPGTVNDALKILKLLCRYAVHLDTIKEISFRIEFLKVQRKPRATVSAPKVQEFLAAVETAAQNALTPAAGSGTRNQ